ncbi:MAG TPA: DUF92 domain-containing protein [Candidatus Baltobacteraceae bacterium]|nr:DUF92 domain-containing protein [Candidatus Baltobacteraceae bacterium]
MTRIGLSPGGSVAAAIVGTLVWIFGGWQCMVVLLAFFIPSTLISRVGRARKRKLVDIGKHGPRDAMQVLANGGVATLAVLFARHFGAPAFAAFAGAFAAASADTWATEIGTLARGAPRSILTLRPLASGLSGGITAQGSLAQVGGALVVAITAALLHVAALLPVLVAGVAGSLVDSVLGATLQTLRYCPQCARECETDPHVCGTPTVVRRGLRWMSNDTVNFAATLCGAILAFCGI